MNQNQISDLLQTALTNTDVDRQYMAARDLCEILTSGYQAQQTEASPQVVIQIYDMYLKHLASQYRDIQGNAIKCLQSLSVQMKSNEFKDLVPKLLTVAAKQELSEFRENFSICLQEILDKVDASVGNAQFIPVLFTRVVEQINISKNKNKELAKSKQIVHQEIQLGVQIQAELLKLLSSVMTKWPIYCKEDISASLLDNIINQAEASIRKNSCICLGALGLCLTSAQLNTLIKDKILTLIQKPGYDNNNFQKHLYINQSLSHLAKSSGNLWNQTVIKQFMQIFEINVNEHTSGKVDIDLCNQYAEIMEIQISAVSNILSNSNVRAYDHRLLDELVILVDFDPLGMTNTAEVYDEYQDDYYEVEDSTWRVRRAVIQALQELIKTNPSIFKQLISLCFGDKNAIFQRLNEKNNDIKTAVVQFLITIVQSFTITVPEGMIFEEPLPTLNKQRSVESHISIEQFTLKLLSQIYQVFNDSNQPQSIKSDSGKLLIQMSHHFQSQIQDSQECFARFLQICQYILKQESSNELKITAINSLKQLTKFTNIQSFQLNIAKEIIQLALYSVQLKQLRVVVEGYAVIDNLITVLANDQSIGQIKQNLLEKIQIENLDQDTKSSILHSTSVLIKQQLKIFTEADIKLLENVLIQRLKLEQTIPSSLELIQVLPPIKDAQNLIQLTSNLVLKQEKNIKIQTYFALVCLINNNQITDAQANETVTKLKTISQDYYDYQIASFNAILRKKFVKLPDQTILDAIKLVQFSRDRKQVEDFFQLIQSYALVEQFVTKNNMKEESQNYGLIWSGAIKSLPNMKDTIAKLYQTIDDNRQTKLSALRFYHRQHDNQYLNQVVKLIDEKKDPDLAALVLGSSGRDVNQLKQLIINNPNSYYYYIALKEFVEVHKVRTMELAQFLVTQVLDKDKIITSLVGDILGLILEQVNIVPLIFQSLKTNNLSVKSACLSSLKHSQLWVANSGILIQMLQQEKDFGLLSQIVKALTQISQVSKLPDLMNGLRPCLRCFSIRELDFGQFKEKRDDGKDLRSLSFDLLEIAASWLDSNEVLAEAFENLDEDKYDETRLPRLRIMCKLVHGLEPYIQKFIKTFTPVMKSLNQMIVKKDPQFDKELEKLRLIVYIVDHLHSEQISDFIRDNITPDVRTVLNK